MSRWLNGLNEEQKIAVRHDEGPMLILAGAGSGKTTVLVARAGRLIDEGRVEAKRLCVLTFTNKAARELKHRVASRLGAAAEGVWAGTFHSFGATLLRRHHKAAGLPREFGILDAGDAAGIVKELIRDLNVRGKTAFDEERLLQLLSAWREAGRKSAARDDDYEVAVEWLLPRYLKRLEHLGMVDFDGLLLEPIRLMKEEPRVREAVQGAFDQVMVDEFQDTNVAQMRFLRLLSETHRNLTVVGDDDQAIYGWRGACVKNILDFPKEYRGCKVVRLEQNYRSTPIILKIANAVIAKNTLRHDKVLRPRADAGDGVVPEIFVYDTENEEAEGIARELSALSGGGTPRRDLAVLYRSNSQGALIEAELRKMQMPYQISGGTAFFDRKEIRDVLAYLRSALKPNEVAFRRVLASVSRGIGDKTIERLTELARDGGVPFLRASREWRGRGIDEKAGAALDVLWAELDGLAPRILGASGSPANELLAFLGATGYRRHVERHSADAVAFQKRWRLVELFAGILDRFLQRARTAESLREFLDAMELRDTLEDAEGEVDKVQLLTLHACKGLEWPVVFLMGVEEDLLPHRTLGADIAEERRLFYVGVTRAKERLILTRAKKRRRHGKIVDSPPSRFLLEIPKGLVKEYDGVRPIAPEKRKAMLAEYFKRFE